MATTATTVSFGPELFSFLTDLRANNDRDWFAANRDRYEQHLLEPALVFIDAFAPQLEKISPHFRADARPSGGSLFRIYRDTRFSKDKSPYKTNLGIHFRHERAKDVHAPGFYLHIGPGEVFAGGGIWHPPTEAATRIREAIVADPERWRKATRSGVFAKRLELGGESLKRVPPWADPEHPFADDLRRKDCFGWARLSDGDVVAPAGSSTAVRHRRTEHLVVGLRIDVCFLVADHHGRRRRRREVRPEPEGIVRARSKADAMRSEPLAGGTTEVLERYARLSLERDELAARVAELERELAARRPVDVPRRSRRRDALVWLGVVLASALTLGVVLLGAAIIAGLWEPLEDDQAVPALATSAPPPTVPQSGPVPVPEPSRAGSPPAPSLTREPPTSAGAPARVELVIIAAVGDSWLQVRRGTASGPIAYEGVLRRGGSRLFSARRLWFRFGVGDHLEVRVNGKPATNLPSLAGDAAATSAGVRLLGVG